MEDRTHYLIAGRLVPYKKVDLAISVFNKLKLPLVVVGLGSEDSRLKGMAGDNIAFVGMVDDDELMNYYRRAKALIFPADEDFGLVPVEAQASGTPVIALNRGGARETVIDKVTGVLFKDQTDASLSIAIKNFEKLKFDPKACVANARNFNQTKFAKEFSAEVNKLWLNHLAHFSA